MRPRPPTPITSQQLARCGFIKGTVGRLSLDDQQHSPANPRIYYNTSTHRREMMKYSSPVDYSRVPEEPFVLDLRVYKKHSDGTVTDMEFGLPTPPRDEPCLSPNTMITNNNNNNSFPSYHPNQPQKPVATRPFKAYPIDTFKLTATTDEAWLKYREEMLSQMRERSKSSCQRKQSTSPTNVQSSSGENEEKDAAYWERRKRNNEAAKRSRDARRAKEDELAIRATYLEQENLRLKQYIAALQHEFSTMLQTLGPPVQTCHLNYN